jgi:hypothetical protein
MRSRLAASPDPLQELRAALGHAGARFPPRCIPSPARPRRVRLLGGGKSPARLNTSLDSLASVLPRAQRAELAGCDHLAPDNSGNQERVAQELRSFYAS